MTDDLDKPAPARPDAAADSFAQALRFGGRGRARGGDEDVAQTTALRLLEHLGFGKSVSPKRGGA